MKIRTKSGDGSLILNVFKIRTLSLNNWKKFKCVFILVKCLIFDKKLQYSSWDWLIAKYYIYDLYNKRKGFFKGICIKNVPLKSAPKSRHLSLAKWFLHWNCEFCCPKVPLFSAWKMHTTKKECRKKLISIHQSTLLI